MNEVEENLVKLKKEFLKESNAENMKNFIDCITNEGVNVYLLANSKTKKIEVITGEKDGTIWLPIYLCESVKKEKDLKEFTIVTMPFKDALDEYCVKRKEGRINGILFDPFSKEPLFLPDELVDNAIETIIKKVAFKGIDIDALLALVSN